MGERGYKTTPFALCRFWRLNPSTATLKIGGDIMNPVGQGGHSNYYWIMLWFLEMVMFGWTVNWY